ncbi:hypothetical protein [Mammaliicoccus sciuri]|uniref:hypothetical protein n=1 Tax=Mammaliicoccus sciuri TaxID=1296 RepID=UPI001FB3DD4F|nr:hypothetical protein [Mammaliicoccus sciuri]
MLNKVEFLETFLSLYINHHEVLKDIENGTSKYVFIEVRNVPKSVKKDKIYVLYDWTGGTMLGKAALLEFYKHEFESYELAGALEDSV